MLIVVFVILSIAKNLMDGNTLPFVGEAIPDQRRFGDNACFLSCVGRQIAAPTRRTCNGRSGQRFFTPFRMTKGGVRKRAKQITLYIHVAFSLKWLYTRRSKMGLVVDYVTDSDVCWFFR